MDDYRAVENLMYRYAFTLDSGDLPGVAELFRHGEIVAPASESVVRGYDEVLEMYNNSTRLYECGTPRTRHIISNVMVEVDDSGTTATAKAYFTVVQATEDFPLQTIISGHYHDSFEKHGGQWRFARKEMYPELFGDLSRHLLFDAASIQ